MPAVSAYTPAPVRRYFALTDDPNSTLGGSSYDTINGNTPFGITADATNFVAAAIPDVVKVWPVSSAAMAWTPTRINLDNLATGIRPGRPEIPFKLLPALTLGGDAYRFEIEKALKLVMGKEVTSGAGPYVHTLTGLPFGATLQPSAMCQLIRDAVNQKMTGVAFESVTCTFPFDGPGTFECEAHPLYAKLIDDSGAPVLPAGTIADATKQPMLLRDVSVVFDGGATAEIGVSQFTFAYRNNSVYDRHIAGACIETASLGGNNYKVWFPAYHKLSGRPAITYGLSFLDSKVAQELALEYAQIRKIVATIADPQGGTDAIAFTLFAAAHDDGGIDPLVAAGDQTAQFTGRAFYSSSDGADVSIAVTNSTAGAL